MINYNLIMKKISFLALHLSVGGIERAICSLANSLCDEYEVEILATYKMTDQPAFFLDERVKYRYLTDVKPNGKEWKDALKHFKLITLIKESFRSIRILKLRSETMAKAVRESDSDIIISSRYLFNKILAENAKKGALKIGWEHNHYNISEKYEKNVVDSIRNLDAFVCCSKDIRDHYADKTAKCVFIPNSIDYYPEESSTLESNDLISVGRFSEEKGYPDMIRVFNRIHELKPELKLNLVGDGAQMNEIKGLISDTYKLDDSVVLHGFQNKDYINNQLNKSSLYLMTSHTESFGIALLEAMAFGIPCIAFDSAEGARELIQNDYNGYLIKDRNVNEYAEKVVEIMSNELLRREFGRNAREFSLNYSADNIRKMWVDLLEGR